ncbi:MAG: hypothetical protein K5790_09540 [Nitrosopumilus sp.]|uniref:formyltransferase family protein n=1 Tax=Nitrosopumilus sp. TaxID=2024843 RepID=UPI00247C0006|nr:formyltransferase family protein [Nitrosopumilus sp.]MCV0393513.1 hypothetical protein [Nitrosopumilus sp.]
MIRVYTKTRHIEKIQKFLTKNNLKHEIYTIYDNPPDTDFELGICYVYTRKITEPLLSKPKKGFVNFHPGPLPKYKASPGISQWNVAIENKEMNWGVTVHYMDEEYDTGPIIRVKKIPLHEPPTSYEELAAISYYFLFELFKETIIDIYNEKIKPISQDEYEEE